jgi:hypothetical protein
LLIQLDNEDVDVPATWQITRDWAAEWEQLSGGHPWLMYTGAWWWKPRGWYGRSLTPYLWDSHYLMADLDTVPDDPAAFAARIPEEWWTPGYGGWSASTFLQFTNRGDAGGLGNNVDLNATKLTRGQLLALTTNGGITVGATRLLAYDAEGVVWVGAGDGTPRHAIGTRTVSEAGAEVWSAGVDIYTNWWASKAGQLLRSTTGSTGVVKRGNGPREVVIAGPWDAMTLDTILGPNWDGDDGETLAHKHAVTLTGSVTSFTGETGPAVPTPASVE